MAIVDIKAIKTIKAAIARSYLTISHFISNNASLLSLDSGQ